MGSGASASKGSAPGHPPSFQPGGSSSSSFGHGGRQGADGWVASSAEASISNSVPNSPPPLIGGSQSADDRRSRSPGPTRLAEHRSPSRRKLSDTPVTPVRPLVGAGGGGTPGRGSARDLQVDAKDKTGRKGIMFNGVPDISYEADVPQPMRSPNYQRPILSTDTDKTVTRSPKPVPHDSSTKDQLHRRGVTRELTRERDILEGEQVSPYPSAAATPVARTNTGGVGPTRGGRAAAGKASTPTPNSTPGGRRGVQRTEEEVGEVAVIDAAFASVPAEGRRPSGGSKEAKGGASGGDGGGAESTAYGRLKSRDPSDVSQGTSVRRLNQDGSGELGGRVRNSTLSPPPSMSNSLGLSDADDVQGSRRAGRMQRAQSNDVPGTPTPADARSLGPTSPQPTPTRPPRSAPLGTSNKGGGEQQGDRRGSGEKSVAALELAMGGPATAMGKKMKLLRAVSSDDSDDDGPPVSSVKRVVGRPGGPSLQVQDIAQQPTKQRMQDGRVTPDGRGTPGAGGGKEGGATKAYKEQSLAFLNDDDDEDDDDSDDSYGLGAKPVARQPKKASAVKAQDDVYDWTQESKTTTSAGKPEAKSPPPKQPAGRGGGGAGASVVAGRPVAPSYSVARKEIDDFLNGDSFDEGEEIGDFLDDDEVDPPPKNKGSGQAKKHPVPPLKGVGDDEDDDTEDEDDADDVQVYDWCAFDTNGGHKAHPQVQTSPPPMTKSPVTVPASAARPTSKTDSDRPGSVPAQQPPPLRDKAYKVVDSFDSFLSSDEDEVDNKKKGKAAAVVPKPKAAKAKLADDEGDDDDDDDEGSEGNAVSVYDWCALDTSDGAKVTESRPQVPPSAAGVVSPSISPTPLQQGAPRPASGNTAGPLTVSVSNRQGGVVRGVPRPEVSPRTQYDGSSELRARSAGLSPDPRQQPSPATSVNGLRPSPVVPTGAIGLNTPLRGSPGGFNMSPGGSPIVRPPAISILAAGVGGTPSPSGVFSPGGVNSPLQNMSPSQLGVEGITSPSKLISGRMVSLGLASVTPKSGPQTPSSRRSSDGWEEVAGTPSVKDTHEVTRKKASLPTTISHEKPTTGNWLKSRTIVNNYILLDLLGTGSYAEVRLCKDKTTNKLHAMKIIKKENMKKGAAKFYEDVKAEIAIMKKLSHPNVLRLYEVLDDPKVNKLYLVLEYMKKGDLMHVLKGDQSTNTCQSLGDHETWSILRQVTKGLAYLHAQNIVHGDIKPQNLLVGDDGIVKIADFGISKILHGSNQKLLDTAGTPAFMSPEICSGESYSGQLADIWALGATMFMIRCGRPPFMANSVLQIYYKIQNDPVTFPVVMDPGLRNLLEGMMIKDPTQRLTLSDVLNDPWLRGGAGGHIIDPMFDPSPKYDTITVSHDEIYKSVKELQGKQTTHAETSFEVVEEGNSESEASSPSSRGATPGSGRRQKISPSPAPQRSPLPVPEPVAEVAETRDEMGENEEARRAAAFSKRVVGRKKSVMATMGDKDVKSQLEQAMTQGLAKKTAAAPARRKSSTESSEEDEEGEEGESEGSADDESSDGSEIGGLEESKELSHAQFNEIMDTLAARPHAHNMLKFMKAPQMVWGTYFPQPGLHNAALAMSAAWHSVQGRRSAQEDRVTVIPDMSALGSMINSPQTFRNYSFFGVFDGHSGTTCASALQHKLHLALAGQPNFHAALKDAMVNAAVDLDNEICAKLMADEDKCGSTALFAVVDGRNNTLMVANVGDSKAVLSKMGAAVELSKEHRPTRPDERARIEAGGAVIRKDRVNGVLAVSRSFGDVEHKGLGGSDGTGKPVNIVIAVPEVMCEQIGPSCEFVVLASDGLWDVLTPQQVVNLIRGRLHEHRSLETAARDVTSEALANGSVDNVSVVILAFNQRLKMSDASRRPG